MYTPQLCSESRPFTSLITKRSLTASLLTLPTPEEINACWELCRLHNNIGFWVIWIPTAWSIAFAYRAHPDISAFEALKCAATYVPLCFGIKSLIMTIDDILDADVDGMVERTKLRALPRGAITIERAWMFFAAQAIIGIYLANIHLSPTALRISMCVWPIYVLYPTCKRWTNLNAIPLGFMFNVGVFMGWADLLWSRGISIPWEILVPVYVACCAWTFTYECVYQHQDKIDDATLGLHSPAMLLGQYTVPICTATALAFIGLLIYGGNLNGHGAFFYTGALIAAAMLLWRLSRTNVDVPADCKALFMDTPTVGRIILAGLVVDVIHYRLTNNIPL